MNNNTVTPADLLDRMDESDTLLLKAYKKEHEKEYDVALTLAREALRMWPDNIDAKALEIDLAVETKVARVKELEKFMNTLKQNPDNEETRPYMRTKARYVKALISCGMYTKAKNECEEILKIHPNDNQGMRFTLLHLYAYLEDEKAASRLRKQYITKANPQERAIYLLPFALLQFKKGNFQKAKMLLNKLCEDNEEAKTFLKSYPESIKENADLVVNGYYRAGDVVSEMYVTLTGYPFAYDATPGFMEWVKTEVFLE